MPLSLPLFEFYIKTDALWSRKLQPHPHDTLKHWNWTQCAIREDRMCSECGNVLHTSEQLINNKHLECSLKTSQRLWLSQCALSFIPYVTYACHTLTFSLCWLTHANHSCLIKRFDYSKKKCLLLLLLLLIVNVCLMALCFYDKSPFSVCVHSHHHVQCLAIAYNATQF